MNTIGEILAALDLEENEDARIKILKNDETAKMREFSGLYFSKNTNWTYKHRPVPQNLSFDDPPYGHSDSTLSQELRRMYIFVHGSHNENTQDKILHQMVNALPKFEAEVLVQMLQGKTSDIDGFDLALMEKIGWLQSKP